jgi:small subunit ribosomal protein S14
MLKRQLFIKSECKNKLLKSIKLSKNISYYERYKSTYFLSKIPRSVSRTQQRNRCVMSGRVYFINSKTQYSRFKLRDNAYAANIPGLRRAS